MLRLKQLFIAQVNLKIYLFVACGDECPCLKSYREMLLCFKLIAEKNKSNKKQIDR
jgi:hypothetical protein